MVIPDRSSAKGAPFGGTSSVMLISSPPRRSVTASDTQTSRLAVSKATTSGWPGSGRRTRAVTRNPSVIGSTWQVTPVTPASPAVSARA